MNGNALSMAVVRLCRWLVPAVLMIGCAGASKAVVTPPAAAVKKVANTVAPTPTPQAKPKAVVLPELPPVLMGKTMGRAQLAAAKPRDDSLPTDKDLEGAWARVFLRSNPGPFQYVAYEVTGRGAAGVISHTRGTMGRKDPIMRTELIDREKLRRIMGRLRDLDAAKMVDPGPLVKPEPPKSKRRRKRARAATAADVDEEAEQKRWPDASPVAIYELSFQLAGETKTIVVADPYASSDRRYPQFINAVREEVIGTVGEVGWHAGTSASTEAGYLFIDSVPSATVTIDGVKLTEKTPIFSFPTSAGKHEVTLQNELHGLKRTYKVVVKRGVTTSLEVDLR